MTTQMSGSARRQRRWWHIQPWRLAAALFALWGLLMTLWTLHLSGRLWRDDEPPPADGAEESLAEPRYVPFDWAQLPGWQEDRLRDALPAFVRSCEVWDRLAVDRPIEPRGIGGTVGDWRRVCAAAREETLEDEELRALFESELQALAVFSGRHWIGLFTGYYEPVLRGSRRRQGPYRLPLYRRPPELVSVDLGRFRDSLAGQRLAGRVVGNTLRPYASRSEIEAGALAGRGLELLWVDDPVDAFFLHIQGSGSVQLAAGGSTRVAYDGQNGHPYYAIGRELVARGAMTLEEVSMQSIRLWLGRHPEAAAEVMSRNASYVFFRELDGQGPVGSLGVVLVAGRSLAVDRRYLPLGAPIWLSASAPPADGAGPDLPLQRLVVAHDTGGAIRGPVRGDVYWGAGAEAASVAGRMRQEGRYWLLLPRPLAQRVLARQAAAPGS